MWERWRKNRAKSPKDEMVTLEVAPDSFTAPFSGAEQVKKKKKHKVRQRQLFRIACIGAGLQFGWAIQLSLLTPYVQELGIPHTFSSYIWLCGPISGFLVQPTVGYYSDNCRSRWGPRRPFIVAGALAVLVSVLLIGFSADLGHLLGDRLESKTKTRAIVLFIAGFWMLDLANNTLTGPVRALLIDLAGQSQRRTRRALAFFTLFLAIGNVLGYAAGSYSDWARIFPFAKSIACNNACANLKSTFFLAIILLVITTLLSITAAKETPLTGPEDNKNNVVGDITITIDIDGTSQENGLRRMQSDAGERSRDIELGRQNFSDSMIENGKLVAKPWNMAKDELDQHFSRTEVVQEETENETENEAATAGMDDNKAFFWELFSHMKTMSRQMWLIMLVTALTWIAWFPYLLYDTDWMGKEIYRGQPDSKVPALTDNYNKGVRMGSVGLMLNSVVLGVVSLMVEPLCRRFGPSYLWAAMNVLLALCFAGLVAITKAARHGPVPPSSTILAIILVLFAIIGAPQAISYNVPYSLMASSTRNSGGGQGLSMGVLNLAVVIPQVLVSLTIGPFDQAFGGSNLPSFLLGAGAALVSGVLAAAAVKNPPKHARIPFTATHITSPAGIRRTRSAPLFLKLA